jgi:GT2 family glycosyltransferase
MSSRPVDSSHLEQADKSSLGDVSFVVPTCRRPDALRVTLSALLAVEYPSSGYEIVVVDDGSSVERLVADFRGGPVAVHYRAQSGRGAAATRNLGARLASGELLVFCDDDVVVSGDHARRHLHAHERFERALVNGISSLPPQTLAEFESTPFGRYRLELERSYEAEADIDPLGEDRFAASLLSARNLSIRRDLFWEIGGFDEGFPWAGAEDQDLSLRAERAGCTLVRDHNIRILHNEQILSVGQFCTREERSAETMVVLCEKYPDEARRRALFRENSYLTLGDGAKLTIKKALKSIFAQPPVLAMIDRVVPLIERSSVPEGALHRIYRGLVGLHIFRGVRRGLQKRNQVSGR